MKNEIFKRIIYGIAYGGSVIIFALTTLMMLDINPPVKVIWLYSCMGMVLGIYFGVASLIFEIDDWSPLKKTTVHYSTSIVVYFIIALSVGWIPPEIVPIMLSILTFTVVYILFWFGYRLYYKRIEKSLNQNL